MKKKITQILVLAMVICTTAFAGKIDDKVNKTVLTIFTEKFSNAREVSWSSTAGYVKASFELNGQYMSAFFTRAGELIGTARNMVSTQLPLNLQASLKKYLTVSWIIELFEYSTPDDTTYYVTIENADQVVVIKSEDAISWSVVRKIRKVN